MIRRVAPATALVFASALALSACAQPAASPTAWQQSVQTVAEQASAGDYASALASLDALEAEVTARRDAGEITAEEADAILARIATVRADLASLVPAPSSSPTPEQTAAPQESVEPEETSEPEETAEPEPSETAEPEPTETAEPTPADPQNSGGSGSGTPSSGSENKGPKDGGPGGKDDKKPGDGATPDPGKKGG